MRRFNIEEYEAGNKNVVTRDGRPVEILKIVKNTKTALPVIVLYDDCDVDFVTEDVRNVTYNTKRDSRDHISCNDLFFAEDKKKKRLTITFTKHLSEGVSLVYFHKKDKGEFYGRFFHLTWYCKWKNILKS